VRVLLALAVPALALLPAPPAGRAAEPMAAVGSRAPAGALGPRIDAWLRQAGLAPEQVSLLLYSTRERRYLYRLRDDAPMIAASNTKLVTTYAALRVLSPNFRWRTRLYGVDDHDGPGGATRQGLLLEASGDPTVTARGLDALALRLKAEGLRRIDGPILLDDSLFDLAAAVAAEGPVEQTPDADNPTYVPLSPFVVDSNAVEFVITLDREGGIPQVIHPLPAEAARIVTRFRDGARSVIRVAQDWEPGGGTFTFSGTLNPDPKFHYVTVPVTRPALYYYQLLRAALRRQGILGEPPLGPRPAEGLARRLLFTQYSPPLRDAIADINKNSNNLGAELLVRAMGMTVKTTGVSAADGMQVLRRAIAEDFPGLGAHQHLVDGSGLSRANRISALFLVKLLNRVQRFPEFRAEFMNALSVARWDGTLRNRDFPEALQGRLRAKSGTLQGVSNLSGFLTPGQDTVVFSFLINDSERPPEATQHMQDRVLGQIYEALAEDTPAPAGPTLAKPGARKHASRPAPHPARKTAPAPAAKPSRAAPPGG